MFLKELKNINLTFIENRNWLLFCESDDDDDDDDDDDGGGDGGDSDEDDDGGGGDGWFLKSEDLKGSVRIHFTSHGMKFCFVQTFHIVIELI